MDIISLRCVHLLCSDGPPMSECLRTIQPYTQYNGSHGETAGITRIATRRGAENLLRQCDSDKTYHKGGIIDYWTSMNMNKSLAFPRHNFVQNIRGVIDGKAHKQARVKGRKEEE